MATFHKHCGQGEALAGVQGSMELIIAEKILQHCALVAAQEAGEDSAGRQALKLLAPEEVANRACDIAEHFVKQSNERGWIRDAPITPEEAVIRDGLLRGIGERAGWAIGDDRDGERLSDLRDRIAKLAAPETAVVE